MNPIARSLLAFVAMGAAVIVLGKLAIYREEHAPAAEPRVVVKESLAALRQAEVEAADKLFAAQMEKEKALYEEEKKAEELRELAELSHEVRLLRIEIEHRAALVAIGKKYSAPQP